MPMRGQQQALVLRHDAFCQQIMCRDLFFVWVFLQAGRRVNGDESDVEEAQVGQVRSEMYDLYITYMHMYAMVMHAHCIRMGHGGKWACTFPRITKDAFTRVDCT